MVGSFSKPSDYTLVTPNTHGFSSREWVGGGSDKEHSDRAQWAFLGKPFSKPPEASNLIFFAQLTPVCVINALASKNIQLYEPQGPQSAPNDPKTGF